MNSYIKSFCSKTFNLEDVLLNLYSAFTALLWMMPQEEKILKFLWLISYLSIMLKRTQSRWLIKYLMAKKNYYQIIWGLERPFNFSFKHLMFNFPSHHLLGLEKLLKWWDFTSQGTQFSLCKTALPFIVSSLVIILPKFWYFPKCNFAMSFLSKLNAVFC